jgi:hypothetical protein
MSLAVPDCFTDASSTVSLCYCRSPDAKEINVAEAVLRASSNERFCVSDRRVGRRDQKSAGSALMFGRGIADFPAAQHQKKAKFRPSTVPNK